MNSTQPVVSQQPWNQNPLNTLSVMKLPGSLLNRDILEKTTRRQLLYWQKRAASKQGTEETAIQRTGFLPRVNSSIILLPTQDKLKWSFGTWSTGLAKMVDNPGQNTYFFHQALQRRIRGGRVSPVFLSSGPGLTSHYHHITFNQYVASVCWGGQWEEGSSSYCLHVSYGTRGIITIKVKAKNKQLAMVPFLVSVPCLYWFATLVYIKQPS